jgi:vacuolar-type H+-ATPase subunit H
MTDYPYGTTSAPPIDSGANPPSTDTESTSVKDKASDSVDAGKQAAGEVAQTATDKAKDVAQETKKQTRDLIGEARDQLNHQAGAQHRSLVNNLRALAEELGTMAGGSEDGGVATDLVGQAGDRAHGAADWLDRREPGDLLGELRTYARRHPGAFLLGAAAAGIMAGRLTRGVVAARSDDSDSAPANHRTAATDSTAATPRHDVYATPGNDYGPPTYEAPGSQQAPTYEAPAYEAPAYGRGGYGAGSGVTP